ncbi:MAG TPA: GTPase domain-containing protein [Bradyrhizobium sp.]|nr:GTPase domain-containing protein [Bradyrhizobium sp.]
MPKLLFQLSFVFFIAIGGFASNYGHAQPKPATTSPPVTSTAVFPDITKLDQPQCEKLKLAPLSCPEGLPGAACQSAKATADLKCKEILGDWSIFGFLPNGTKEKFVEYAALIIFGLLGLAASNVHAWIKAKKAKADALQSNEQARQSNEQVIKLENRALDPFFDRPVDFDQYATNMILVGEGGSGKTTLIHALSGAGEAQPDVATNEMSTYTLVHEISIEQKGGTIRRLVRIYSDDYEGQNWVQGTQSEQVKARQQFIKSSSLVIVVDLIGPGSKSAPTSGAGKLHSKRIKEQLLIYNDPAVQSLASLLGPNGQIILFINKADLIYPLTDERIEEAKASYAPLVEQLRELRGVRLRVIVGSAMTGFGVVGYDDGHEERKSLLKLVIDHARKIDLNQMKAIRDGRSKAPG